MRSRRVILYALSTCGWCRRTKELLNQNSVEHEFCDIDVATGHEKKQAMAEVKKLNHHGSYPTIVIGNEVVVGFDQDRIIRLLGLEEAVRRAKETVERARQEKAEEQRIAEEERRQAEEERRKKAGDIEDLRTKLKSLAVEGTGLEQKFAYAEISAAEYTARKNKIAQEIESAKNKLAELESKPAEAVADASPTPPTPGDNLRLIKQRFLDGEIDRAEYESLISLNEASAGATAKPNNDSPDDVMKEFENLLKSGAISEDKFKELKAKYEASRRI